MTVIHPSVERFIEYLRIKTVQPTPDYATCQAFLERQAQELGLEFWAKEYVSGKPVVVLSWTGTEPELPSIILNSHTDVVPVFEEFWTHPPFEAARVATGTGDYKIIARGAQDMKIVGHGYLEAVRAMQAQGTRLRRTLHLVYVPDEEIGGHDGMALFVKSPEFLALNAGFALDEGMANPQPELRVFYGERAPCWVRFVAHGNTGHGSQFIEDTAAEKLVPIINYLMEFRREQLDKFRTPHDDGSVRTLGDVTSSNLTMLDSGVQHNVVPERASVCFDIRMTPSINYEEFRRGLEDLAARHGAELEMVQFWDDNTMTGTTPADPFWAPFAAAIDGLGMQIAKEIFPAATDSRYLRRAGVPALGVTPLCNTPILLHDHNEYVLESDVLAATDFYVRVIAAVANAD
ncbi:adenylate cyclase [Coemansia sp. RSA 353]|nr:adenylate cyclase [Coemansia sp. RSA 1824]KAJ2129339.1 adenylate cyclase [Coemansia sp. RSA 921]KAJ2136184.1 adenylate cyclase [Coemansia sp. RSA 788]KAJ2161432.1 adenylate cyclase [Coemansia sp. RSA 562]KAJ2171876.1 adenylate cyclase [Coemansia sp. RSA 560]KAJ2182880.1 adenylate cyclase [Coemansia sp. RSA 551]KAJ2183107.1 adenylate cyclase [Coemansia sp. RSA 532]KAJ2192045.1 adenylate cyclase [Coemansia sp. RSA 522]KAJ2196311.1 adenylate cyclase [Coemansia sp. RSA 530]KAJ2202234.1 aden